MGPLGCSLRHRLEGSSTPKRLGQRVIDLSRIGQGDDRLSGNER